VGGFGWGGVGVFPVFGGLFLWSFSGGVFRFRGVVLVFRAFSILFPLQFLMSYVAGLSYCYLDLPLLAFTPWYPFNTPAGPSGLFLTVSEWVDNDRFLVD